MSRVHLRIADEEGTERELASFEGGDVPDRRDPILLGALAWLKSEAATRRAGWPRLAIFLTLGLALLSFLPIVAVAVGVRRSGLPPYYFVVALPMVIGMAVITLGHLGGALAGKALAPCADLVRDAMLRMRRCASCGYPLHPDAGEGGERVRCSECGAHWPATRLGRLGCAAAGPVEAARLRQSIFAAAGCRSRRRDAAGRRYASILLAQRRGESSLWRRVIQRRTRRSEWIAVVALLGSIAAGVLLAFVAPDRAQVPWFLGAGLVVGHIVFFLLIARIRRRADRMRLRLRRCLACEGRLRPKDDRLFCAACDATWKAIP